MWRTIFIRRPPYRLLKFVSQGVGFGVQGFGARGVGGFWRLLGLRVV